VGGRSEYLCYTDGSCKAGAGAPGRWGFHIKPPSGAPLEGYGKATGTLAKVMELRAVAEALAELPEGATAVRRRSPYAGRRLTCRHPPPSVQA
jgi:ribonuclease HI